MENKDYTDMYFIAGLLSYGFELINSDRGSATRQRFSFISDIKIVYITDLQGKVESRKAGLSEIENFYNSKKLMFPPTYPDILKRLKQDIVSYKNDDNK